MTRLRDWGFTAIALTALMTLMALRPLALQAQTYPAKTVRIIVPFTPGGGTDFIARLIGAKLSSAWGQQFVVENRVGAGSTLGSEFALKSPPDGYTLLLTSGSYTASPSLYKLRYDPIKDMTPITLTAIFPFVLVTNDKVPAKKLAPAAGTPERYRLQFYYKSLTCSFRFDDLNSLSRLLAFFNIDQRASLTNFRCELPPDRTCQAALGISNVFAQPGEKIEGLAQRQWQPHRDSSSQCTRDPGRAHQPPVPFHLLRPPIPLSHCEAPAGPSARTAG